MPPEQVIPAASPIGRATPRVEGPAQGDRGRRGYTSDFHFPGLLYAVPVEATIASGRVVELDTAAAEKMPGVRAILHRENVGKIYRSVPGPGFEGICEERRPRRSRTTWFAITAKYVALAVADTFETAKAAADAVRVTYAKENPNVEAHLEADGRTRSGRHHVRHARALAKPARRRRGRFRVRAGQGRSDLCHAGRNPKPARVARDDRDLGRRQADAVRVVAGSRQPARRARADARIAERERPRHHPIRGLGLWQQAVAMDSMSARCRRGAAGGKPVKLVLSRKMMFQSVGQPAAHPTARTTGRYPRREARLAAARLPLPAVHARRPPRRLRAKRRRSSTASPISA